MHMPLSILLPAKAALRPWISSRPLRNISASHCVLLTSRVGLPGRAPPLTNNEVGDEPDLITLKPGLCLAMFSKYLSAYSC
jgi:hypothetical protein